MDVGHRHTVRKESQSQAIFILNLPFSHEKKYITILSTSMLLRPRVQACLLRSSVRALPMRLRQRLPAQPLNFAMMFSSAIFPPAADVFDQITRGVTNMTFRSKPVKAVVKDDSLDIGWCKLDMMCFGMRNIQSSVHIFYYLCAICSQQLTATQLPSFISCFFLFLTDFDDAGCFNITVCFSPFIHAHVL